MKSVQSKMVISTSMSTEREDTLLAAYGLRISRVAAVETGMGTSGFSSLSAHLLLTL